MDRQPPELEPLEPVDEVSENRFRDPVRVLKAGGSQGQSTFASFDFQSLARRCDEHVQWAQAESRRLLEVAVAQSAEMNRQAHEEGYANGFARGRADAERDIKERIQSEAERLAEQRWNEFSPVVTQVVEQLQAQSEQWRAQWDQAAIEICIAIAERVLRQQLNHSPEISRQLIASILELAVGEPKIRLRIHPDDAACLGEFRASFVQRITECGECEIVEDDTIRLGGCIIETPHGAIDGRIETQLQRIRDELLR